MEYEKLAPAEYRKIAQNDDQHGNVLAVVFYDPTSRRFYIQAQNVDGSGWEVFGPLAKHVFDNIMAIMSDIKDMEGRFNPLE